MFSLPKAGLIAGLTFTCLFGPLALAEDRTPENANKLNQPHSELVGTPEWNMTMAKALIAMLVDSEVFWVREAESLAQAGQLPTFGKNARALAAHNNGFRLAVLGRKQEALQSYSEALRLDPTYFPSYFERARIFAAEFKWKEVTPEVEQGLALIRSLIVR